MAIVLIETEQAFVLDKNCDGALACRLLITAAGESEEKKRSYVTGFVAGQRDLPIEEKLNVIKLSLRDSLINSKEFHQATYNLVADSAKRKFLEKELRALMGPGQQAHHELTDKLKKIEEEAMDELGFTQVASP